MTTKLRIILLFINGIINMPCVVYYINMDVRVFNANSIWEKGL